jgi:hypothetical protein
VICPPPGPRARAGVHPVLLRDARAVAPHERPARVPHHRSSLEAWLSNVEIDRNDMADYTEKVLLFWRSNAPKFPA